MRMKSGWVLMLVVLFTIVMPNCVSSKLGSSSGPSFVWVATQGDQKVSAFSVNLSTGGVSQVGTSVATGVTPSAMAITPDGKTLFVANRGDNTISAYSVNSSGSLGTPSTASAGQIPVALGPDPAGKFLFVANQGILADPASGTISVFAIQGTALSAVPGSPFRTVPSNDLIDTMGTGPSAVVAAPLGNFVYVANQFTNDISIFSYDSTGALTLITTCGAAPNCASPRMAAGVNPTGLAFARCAGTATATSNCTAPGSSNYLFVANSGSNDISIFGACIQVSASCSTPNGSLTSNGSPVGAGSAPVSLLVDPQFNFVYAVDEKSFQVSQYQFSSATGALTPLSPSAVSTGANSNPISGGITSDGNWGFVPNNGGSSMAVYHVNTNGTLAPASTASVTLSGQPSAIVVR
jgi:6-phosphogluconolactonase (cycloisomerase 2 family)